MIEVRITGYGGGMGGGKPIARLTITNDGTGDAERGNYDALLQLETAFGQSRAARVEGFDRAEPAWCLVYDALAPIVARERAKANGDAE